MKILPAAAALLLLSVVMGCKKCDDDPKPPGLTCDNGFEPIDGVCDCPDGKHIVLDTCRGLRTNEFYGIRSDCPCGDTLLIQVTDIDTVNRKAKIVLSPGMVYPAIDGFSQSVYRKVSYLPLADGDSLFYPKWDPEFPPWCFFAGQAGGQRLCAKFIASDKLRVHFAYISNHGPDTIAQCTTIFHR